MIHIHALDMLRRHAPVPFGWCEIVTGYDFGILSIGEIQDWLRSLGPHGPATERLIHLSSQELPCFEEHLWTACSEALGARVPRPGHQRWSQAQDLWRMALLKEALAWPLEDHAFAEAVDAIIDGVGCPEDMLGLVRRPGHGQPLAADRRKVATFVRELETRLLPEAPAWVALAAS